MKYQITCDNCGTQFIVEAEEGQTVECNCPHCHGVMEITLPLVSLGQQYEQPVSYSQQTQETMPKKSSHAILWGVVIGLLLLAGGVGAYFILGSSSPQTPVTDSIPNDTIPYETPVQIEPEQSVDTVVEAPVQTAPEVRENIEEAPEESTDTVEAHSNEQ
jgi:hypothetical protein